MSDTNRWIVVSSVVVVALALLVVGIVLGRLTVSSDASSGSASSVSEGFESASLGDATTTSAEGVATFGSAQARDDLVGTLIAAGLAEGNRDVILMMADEICFNLERLEAQGRSAAFAVRVVWNESLAELAPRELATFASVFTAAPRFLCPAFLGYAVEVAYWLGY